MFKQNQIKDYNCWLNYNKIKDHKIKDHKIKEYQKYLSNVFVIGENVILNSIKKELTYAINLLINKKPVISKHLEKSQEKSQFLLVAKPEESSLIKNEISEERLNKLTNEGFLIKGISKSEKEYIIITGQDERGLLYGVFHLLRLIQNQIDLSEIDVLENPVNQVRMINHWDNMDGSIERGYAGKSIYYEDNEITTDLDRVHDYARLLASIGINSVSINNVNVHQEETKLIAEKMDYASKFASIFRKYGIKIFLSINFASPIEIGKLETADPLDKRVAKWWENKVDEIYQQIPDFGGFLVKADSEHRPGPFTYDRTHADGANMLAEALRAYNGLLIWRCFVYNCQQNWRDRSTDRAKAAYDNFKPLDGEFLDNVILQIKNGPMDFQVREPVSPLFGGMEETNQMLELQITQEYTGQQKHLCYLVPQWKEILEFDTYAKGEGSTVKKVVDGSLYDSQHSGFAAVVNVGRDDNWTGHTLAQANLYGYGRLAWNPDMTVEEITEEWTRCTFGSDEKVINNVSEMLLDSWEIYENYTSPLGVGWMVNPGHHYGPNVDGYEYSRWGTYHFADCFGIGVDRTMRTGTGYTGQYHKENSVVYESLKLCPDELLLFFHHVPYTHILKSGKTVIQHIYDTHFEGVEQAKELKEKWQNLASKINQKTYKHVLGRLDKQIENAKEWRDIINTYFYRKSGIPDKENRKIY